MYSQDSLLLQFYYKVQVYVNNLRTWLGEELQCLTQISFCFGEIFIGTKLQDISHLTVLSLEYLKYCEMRNADKLLDIYGANCQVGLISREHRNARKFLRTSCEFLIFLLDLYSKQVRFIHSLFYCMPAGSNLQRLKSAEMKKHFYSNTSEKEIEREKSQRKILNSGILT